jgi:hypothetical protein
MHSIVSHIFTPTVGFCFRSKQNPFRPNYIHFWNTFGTVPGACPDEDLTARRRRVAVAFTSPACTPSLGISRFRLCSLRPLSSSAKKCEKGRQQLVLSTPDPSPFAAFPCAGRPAPSPFHSPRNGRSFLDITGHPGPELPFGQDRLIPMWVATRAVQQKSRIARSQSAAQMLDFLRLSKDGSVITAESCKAFIASLPPRAVATRPSRYPAGVTG